ncbi:hypothetical protein PIIN_04126 [Serendipita indica DSM 11827]|uniref:Uncharacterized protein n=1 Tax=Serendipita indica (strain DSM 11827) TaxID=1109443 RepID=G4TFW9_SERID|nr:hypothetical protein PIIN_04126 [Serendipita indica DSM 11827]
MAHRVGIFEFQTRWLRWKDLGGSRGALLVQRLHH